MNWFMIIRIKHESESEKYKYCWHRFFFLQRYAFLLKDAKIYWKMFEGEGNNRKKQRKKAFLLSLSKYLCTFAKIKNPGSSPASNNLGEGLTGTALQR